MNEDQLHDLHDRTTELLDLLDEWEPGLFTWNSAVNDAWWKIVQWAPKAALRRLLQETSIKEVEEL